MTRRHGIPFWLVGEFTTYFRTYFSDWIGMFTGCTIWILTHAKPAPRIAWLSGELEARDCRRHSFRVIYFVFS